MKHWQIGDFLNETLSGLTHHAITLFHFCALSSMQLQCIHGVPTHAPRAVLVWPIMPRAMTKWAEQKKTRIGSSRNNSKKNRLAGTETPEYYC